MEEILTIFHEVNPNEEKLSLDDLKKYSRSNAQRLMKLYDQDKDGYISLYEFCDQIGFNYERKKREIYKLEYISVKVTEEQKISITDFVYANFCESDVKLAEMLKHWLDNNHKDQWHAFVMRGAFWAEYSCSIDSAISFKIDKRIFLIFATP